MPKTTYAQTAVARPGAAPISVSAAAAVTRAPRVVGTGPATRTAARPRKLPAPAVRATATSVTVVRSGGSRRCSVTAGTVVYTAATDTPCAANARVADLRAPAFAAGRPAWARPGALRDMHGP
ncbi:hypothetical protein ACWD5F_30005 [Streptomyces sp. NPDC002499]